MDAGIRFSIDEPRRQSGVLAMRLTVPDSITKAGDLELEARFPDFYPHFRPQVFAPSLRLPHHQDPFGGNVCLIARGSRLWSEADTLGWLLRVQLPLTLAAAQSPDPLQGEPASHYFGYVSGAVVLVDSDHLPPDDAVQGNVQMRIPSEPVLPQLDGLWMSSIRSFEWTSGKATGSRTTQSVDGIDIETGWVRLADVTSHASPEKLWEAAEEACGSRLNTGHPISSELHLQHLVVLFPEEHGPGEIGTGVLVLGRVQDTRNRAQRRSSKVDAMPTAHHLVRTARAGKSDLTARAPDLTNASGAHVLLVGCGALGSTIADQLARSGIRKLSVVDGDNLEPGNLLRHAATIREVGLNKAEAVAKIAVAANPELDVQAIGKKLGEIRVTDSPPEEALQRQLSTAMAEVDLVIDATAEVAVHEVLADMSRSHGRDFLYAEVTPGAWGGYVVSSPSNSDACWNCSELFIQEGALTLPRGNGGETVQPVACAEPTFTGASFDLAEVAIHAARVAMARLTGKSSDEATFDAVELRDPAGLRDIPVWSRTRVDRHSGCEWHS